jgi:magnesium transporter
MNAVPPETARQWKRNQSYEDGSIGRMMEPALAVFSTGNDSGASRAELRSLVKAAFITYGYVTDATGKLLGVITMRDLLFAEDGTRLDVLMLRDVFSLAPELPLSDAMRLVLDRHYPVYPVCDAQGVLLGLVRGQAMFREQAFDITAQVGSMVGVEKEERLATRWSQSFRFRHPWLQIESAHGICRRRGGQHLRRHGGKAGGAGGVSAGARRAIGQHGCQALAVTLRGLTLGELKPGSERALVMKEGVARPAERRIHRGHRGPRHVSPTPPYKARRMR